MDHDGRFYDVQGKPFELTWPNDGYRLEPVTVVPGLFKVPAPATSVVTRQEIPPVLVVVAERGGGISHFVRWLTQPTRAARAVRARQARAKELNDGDPGWRILEPQQARQALLDWRQAKKPIRLVMDCTIPWEVPHADEKLYLAELASLVEEERWAQESKLVCVTRDVRALRSRYPYSALIDRGPTCRLPHFSRPELEDWARALLQKQRRLAPPDDPEQPTDLPVALKRLFGGQPTLTHLALHLLDQRLSPEAHDSWISNLEEVRTSLVISRPHIVDRWQDDLRPLLEDVGLRRRLEAYTREFTRGERDGDYDQHDVDLFLAGWVGLNPDREWGIRSTCHQAWAREILRG